ncbi:MAG: LysR family transcriptional regulator [Oscillospiraceae bacterium]|nr:LysR family transcriptional regulator [Oscillospiraceae bacterium]
MNILHMKYAVEVAKAGSINKAADILLVAQPNLSRSIKNLEADLGITIFDRSAKGMVLTPEGERFIGYARNILSQIDKVEAMYREGASAVQRFSISGPRASYISDAFARFSATIGTDAAEIFYKETNSMRVISNILTHDYRLGILRYAEMYDRYFKDMLTEKGLVGELITEFRYVLLMRSDSSLASKENLCQADLKNHIEIAHADPFVPNMPAAEVKRTELPDNVERRIFVFERASQFDLLSANPDTFMWVSPAPQKLLDRYGLIQRECVDNTKVYRDVLISRKDYRFTELDRRFIVELERSKMECFA